MYHLVSVDRHSVAVHLTSSDCEGCMSNGMDGTDSDLLWNGSEEGGNVRSECEGDEGTAVKVMMTVTHQMVKADRI